MNPYLFVSLFLAILIAALLFGVYWLVSLIHLLNPLVFLFILVVFFIFIIYLIVDFASSNPNAFMDKWVAKTLWAWLPFYALQRLIKEVILKKK